MTNKEKVIKIKNALKTLKELAPNMFPTEFYRIKCPRKTDLEQIESAVKIYLHAKGIHLTPRVIQLLVMFVKYDTSTTSRKKISRQIKMTRVAINQNVIALKKAGLIIYPYSDTKKSVVHKDLLRLKEYVTQGTKDNILITYVDEK